ncbi:MAG TPA: 2-isopropylmalate synthase [Terriglobales bacterium]|nr:2-isopropylmalate synthase [Terriglobales bacterium]
MTSDYIRILDTTLRDGEQTPGVSLTSDEKVRIARQLDKLGVDAVEAGFPIASIGEAESVAAVVRAGLSCETVGLARANKNDIDVALGTGVGCIHVFIATSDLHLKHKLKLTREEVLERIGESVSYAKQRVKTVEFSAEDATRTDMDFMISAYKTAEKSGADRLNIPDTVGISSPHSIAYVTKELVSAVNIPVSIHCHDDFGLAVANSLASIEAGAVQAHVTMNGIGERAGNTSLEEFVMSVHRLYNRRTRINTELLTETSKLVASLTGVRVSPNKAVIGENAFGHESGIHTHGITEMPLTYEPYDPALVGRKRWFQAGKHAGAHGIAQQLAESGFFPDKNQLGEIVARVKDIGDKGKTVTDADLIAITEAVLGRSTGRERVLDLLDLATVTGKGLIPTASVRLRLNGKEYTSSEIGVGPVDAAIRAVQKITDPSVQVTLKEYRLDAITGGSDALAEALVKVEDANGASVSASSARLDVVVASVEAMIEAINKVLLRRRFQAATNPPLVQS